MEDIILYEVEIIDDFDISKFYNIEVPCYENIIAYIEEKSGKKYHEFRVVSIAKIKKKCIGCEYNSPSQVDHMTHPQGCLHHPSFCDEC